MNTEQQAMRQAAAAERARASQPPNTKAIILALIICTAFVSFIVWQTRRADVTLEHEIHTQVKGLLDNYDQLDRARIKQELEHIERETRPRQREHPEG
jgi:hypothetical protein